MSKIITGNDVLQDQELLKQYVSVSNQAAFSELVRRHMSMVYATIWRLTGDEGLSEEGTQNVFLILSKKAAQCCRVVNLGGWLHQCARNEARNMNRKRGLRREKEMEAYTMMENEKEGISVWKEVLPILDDAIDGLRATDREVIVSRFLEGLSFSQIGKLLGISEDGAQKRASRALERLAAKLKRRGVRISVVMLGAGLTVQTSKAVPSTLLPKLLTTTSVTSAKSVGISALVTHWLSLKCIFLVVLVVGMLATTHMVLKDSDSSSRDIGAVLSPDIEHVSETRLVRRKGKEIVQLSEINASQVRGEMIILECLLRILALRMDSVLVGLPDYELWLKGANIRLNQQQKKELKDLSQRQIITRDRLTSQFRNMAPLLSKEDVARLIVETRAMIAMWRPEDQILHVLRDDQKANFMAYVQKRRIAELEANSSKILAEIDKNIHLNRLQMQPVYDAIYRFGGKTPKMESLEKILTREQLAIYAQYVERN